MKSVILEKILKAFESLGKMKTEIGFIEKIFEYMEQRQLTATEFNIHDLIAKMNVLKKFIDDIIECCPEYGEHKMVFFWNAQPVLLLIDFEGYKDLIIANDDKKLIRELDDIFQQAEMLREKMWKDANKTGGS